MLKVADAEERTPAIVAALVRGVAPPVAVNTRSGEQLIVDFEVSSGRVTNLSLEGGADYLSQGELDPVKLAVQPAS